ncbi:MAG: DUF58 domain-containing protein [Pseudomonadales bacterium]|nr:DUF58 domain-containing protein [Pseudomonadales bacterium]MCP5183977.1 DUF58 domain-containing protein [Pseudomonadales bacterium]
MASSVLANRFGAFLDRRIPPSPSITLSQNNIFIFPTKVGFGFAGLLMLMLLVAINYQSSLIYGIAFTLGSMFLITILYTFRNLAGLRIEFQSAQAGFVGEDVAFTVRLVRPRGAPREGIQLGWPGNLPQWAEVYSQEADAVRLYVRAQRRGWLNPGRLLVETFFPLGLLRAWTWVDLSASALVYPSPVFQDAPVALAGQREEGALVDPRGSEDFTDIRAYAPGDPVKHVLWRSYARSGGGSLMVKRYASYVEPRLVLSLEDVEGDIEERLSRLTGLVLTAAREGREFGLVLPGVDIAAGTGDTHLEAALRALALYGR